MQKLAVALTTQEEFNEYNNYRKSRKWRYSYDYNLFVKRQGSVMWLVIEHDSLWERERKDWFDRNWYKIISLSEAIGEKENKKIIREGEARGLEPKTKKQYRNNILEVSTKTNPETGYKYDIYHDNWYKRPLSFTEEELIWMSFEPIEEPKREWWIDEAFYDYEHRPIDCTMSEYKELFREAIEKHIPRITIDELDKIIWKDPDTQRKYIHYWTMIDFLKSKWLLE